MTKKNHNIAEFEVFIKAQTEKAILVEDLNGKDIWIPKSQIEADELFETGQKQSVQMPEWLAIDKELI